jgi:hypothetical protein
MANTYTLIASATVGSGGTGSFNFTSIPQTYTDLVILSSFRSNRGNSNIADFGVQFNGSSSNYTRRRIFGDGSGVASDTGVALGNAAGNLASTFSSHIVYIPNYTLSNFKSFSIDSVTENNAASSFTYANLIAALWSDTSAITSIEVRDFSDGNTNNLVQYATAYLYGISNS